MSVPNKTTLVTRGDLLTGDDYRFAAQLTVDKWFVGGFDFLSLVQQQDNYPFYAFPVLDIPPGRERVTAGLRNARAKGAVLGRPRLAVDARAVARLRAEGHSWAEVWRADTGCYQQFPSSVVNTPRQRLCPSVLSQ